MRRNIYIYSKDKTYKTKKSREREIGKEFTNKIDLQIMAKIIISGLYIFNWPLTHTMINGCRMYERFEHKTQKY